MSFIKKLFGAADAIKNNFKGANGAFNMMFNHVQVAEANESIEKLRLQLKKTFKEEEIKLIEDEIRQLERTRQHYIKLCKEDAEASQQSRDRLSRIIGTDEESSKHLFREKKESDASCELKSKGDKFELAVGRHLESNGCFVFYNGLLRSEADQGIDLVAYDKKNRVARYIQCKNWEKMTLDHREHILPIMKKMGTHRITPTVVEMQQQKAQGWATNNKFDDSVYYKIHYELIISNRSSLPGITHASIVREKLSNFETEVLQSMAIFIFENDRLVKLVDVNRYAENKEVYKDPVKTPSAEDHIGTKHPELKAMRSDAQKLLESAQSHNQEISSHKIRNQDIFLLKDLRGFLPIFLYEKQTDIHELSIISDIKKGLLKGGHDSSGKWYIHKQHMHL